jgi:hypothetical protein
MIATEIQPVKENRGVFSFINTRNLYTILLVLQVLDLVNVLVLHEMMVTGVLPVPELVFGVFQFLIIALLNAIVLVFVRRFVKSNLLFFTYLAAIFASVFFMFLSESPAGAAMDPANLKLCRFSGILFQVISLCFMLTIVFKDIFQKRHDLGYCLTGAACLFLIIGTVFGVLYALVEISFPGSLTSEAYKNVVIPAIQFSFYTISGQDPIQPAGTLIRNISIFESIFANLYAVMVVGRLMTK